MSDGAQKSLERAKAQLLSNSNLEGALEEGEAALAAFGKARDAKMQVAVFREVLAPAHLKRHDPVKAAAALEAALDLLEGSSGGGGSEEDEESILLELAHVHTEAQRFEDALEAASNVASRAAARGAAREEGEARCLMARIQSRRGKLQAASATAKRARGLLQQAGEPAKALDATNILMEVQLQEKRVSEAVQIAKESLPEALQLKAFPQAAKCVQTLTAASLQQQLPDLEGLVKSSREALRELEKADPDSAAAELRAQYWLAIGSARLEQLRGVSNIQENSLHVEWAMDALQASQEAIHDLQQASGTDTTALSGAYLLLGKIHYIKEEAKLAKVACTSALSLCKARGDPIGSAECLVLIAHSEILALATEEQSPGDANEAIEAAAAAAQEAKATAEKYEIIELQQMATSALASVESARESLAKLALERNDDDDDNDKDSLLGIDTRTRTRAKLSPNYDPRYALWLGAPIERSFARRDVAMERLSALTALA